MRLNNVSFIDPIWPHLIAFTQRIKGLINLIKLYVCLLNICKLTKFDLLTLTQNCNYSANVTAKLVRIICF